MNEFKVGDTVKCIQIPYGEGAESVLVVGKEYIIRRFVDPSYFNFENQPNYPDFIFSQDCFEAIPTIQDNEFIKVMREHKRMLEL